MRFRENAAAVTRASEFVRGYLVNLTISVLPLLPEIHGECFAARIVRKRLRWARIAQALFRIEIDNYSGLSEEKQFLSQVEREHGKTELHESADFMKSLANSLTQKLGRGLLYASSKAGNAFALCSMSLQIGSCARPSFAQFESFSKDYCMTLSHSSILQ